MCTQPLQIYNRSEKLSYRGSALLYTIPCGQCEECKKHKSSEYMLRSYIEYRDTIDKGGFVYFDTLTYSNKYLPKYLGISHFSRKDITLFLKELRVYLTRAGYKIDHNLKYFITSEYGGKTHRPHYHILVYCTVPNLDVKTLWKYMNKAWKFGFLDRLNTAPSRVVNSQAALNYVAKYVEKDSEWQIVVDRKIERLKRLGVVYKLEEVLKDMQPFHRQSQGFGENFLKYIKLDSIMRDGYVQIPDRKFLVKNYALPTYYKRKLFYTLEKKIVDDKPKYSWKINKLGIDYKVNRVDDLINTAAIRFRDILYNLDAYNIDDWFNPVTVRTRIFSLLGDRTFEDLAKYQVVYRNKLWNSKKLPDYKEFYRLSLQDGTNTNLLYSEESVLRSQYRNRVDRLNITQYRYKEFENFDELLNIFSIVVRQMNYYKESKSKQLQATRDRLKLVLAA